VKKQNPISCQEEAVFKNFLYDVVSQIEQANILLWLDFGSLLGWVRDRRLIPWDNDVDFGIWHNKTAEQTILNIFDQKKFNVIKIPGKDSIFIFSKDKSVGHSIHITIYTKHDGNAVSKTFFFPKGFLNLMKNFLFLIFAGGESKPHPNNFVNSILKSVYFLLNHAVLTIVPKRLRCLLAEYFFRFKVPVIYEFPAHFFEKFEFVEFYGLRLRIPRDKEAYLEKAYGKDWLIPRKWKNWYDGATYVGKDSIPESYKFTL
jgi:hypothetical protein